DTDHRRRGIATLLLDRLFEVTAGEGRRGYTLEVRVSNANAIRLYERMGFRARGVRRGYYTDNREDALIMWRDPEPESQAAGPGLIGALLVGLAAATAIAWARGLELAPVDHLHGHVASLYLEPEPLEPPFLCLLASGGHTLLLDVRDRGGYRVAGRSLDD